MTNDISAMYSYARQQMRETVRMWYPNTVIVDLPEVGRGFMAARMSAWLDAATRLANALMAMENQSPYGAEPDYAVLLPAARLRVQQAVREMWPNAFIATRPFGPQLAPTEEFMQYRMGAQVLAMRLAPLCYQAMAAQMNPYGYAQGATSQTPTSQTSAIPQTVPWDPDQNGQNGAASMNGATSKPLLPSPNPKGNTGGDPQ